MYEVRDAGWIRDDIERCRTKIKEIEDKPHNAEEMMDLMNSIHTGMELLREADIMEPLSAEQKAEYNQYLSQLTQYMLSIKWAIKS